MTTTPVNDIGILIPRVSETGGAPPAADGMDFMGKFKSAMETQGTAMNLADNRSQTTDVSTARPNGNDRNVSEVDRTEKTAPDKDPKSVKSEVGKEDTAKAGKGKETAKDSETPAPETVEAISETAEEIVNEAAAILNVTPADILQAMEEIDLSMTDLLDESNMIGLVAQISGDQDTVTLITDENLYQTLETLKDLVSEKATNLMDELDLSQEALDEVLVQTEELIGHVQIADPEIETESVAVTAQIGMPEEVSTGEVKDFKVNTSVGGEQATMDVKVDDATGVQIVTAINREEAAQSDSGKPSQQDTPDGKENKESFHQAPLFTQTTQFNTQINTDFTVLTEEVTGFRTEASDIANQIMENMRANIRPDVTELEMNLHPASLGNVRVNLTSQNGVVTAQFLAQNETVRAAIESQVVQLRETLEAQGVKIEAVEVAVSSQGFDRNRDNSQGQDDNPDRNGSGRGIGRTGRIRRIDLGDLEDLEDLEDADRIAAEMMAHDGNTVDYTV